jgi:hypothetical protein
LGTLNRALICTEANSTKTPNSSARPSCGQPHERQSSARTTPEKRLSGEFAPPASILHTQRLTFVSRSEIAPAPRRPSTCRVPLFARPRQLSPTLEGSSIDQQCVVCPFAKIALTPAAVARAAVAARSHAWGRAAPNANAAFVSAPVSAPSVATSIPWTPFIFTPEL